MTERNAIDLRFHEIKKKYTKVTHTFCTASYTGILAYPPIYPQPYPHPQVGALASKSAHAYRWHK